MKTHHPIILNIFTKHVPTKYNIIFVTLKCKIPIGHLIISFKQVFFMKN